MVDRLIQISRDESHWSSAKDAWAPQPLHTIRRRIIKGAIVVAAAGLTLGWAAMLVWLLIKLFV
jgi:hypothetical protein